MRQARAHQRAPVLTPDPLDPAQGQRGAEDVPAQAACPVVGREHAAWHGAAEVPCDGVANDCAEDDDDPDCPTDTDTDTDTAATGGDSEAEG